MMVTEKMAKQVDEMLERKLEEARKRALERMGHAGPYLMAYNEAAKKTYSLGEACRQVMIEFMLDETMTSDQREIEAHNACHNLIQLLMGLVDTLTEEMPCQKDDRHTDQALN